jgi:ABC-type transport system involved in multi-copper enzyme maturation permease subunit
MLLHLIRKEFHENLLNVRFIAACGVSLVLMVSSIAVLNRSNEEQVLDYQSRVRQQDEFIGKFGHINRLGWMSAISRGPAHLQALVLGIDREAHQDNFISNPVPALLSRLDFVSIVTVIMSLVAILFSYNAISGEREAGLLRQILGAGVSRKVLLTGKFLGGLVSLVIPFTISVLAGMLFLALSPSIQIRPADFSVFAMLLGASWLYVSAFYGIGLFFSTRSHTSGQAILKSLFAWVILVLVIPNAGPFLAAQFYPIPSATKLAQERYMITDRERDAILVQRRDAMIESRFADLRDIIGLPQNQLQEKLKSDAALDERYRLYARGWEDIIAVTNREQGAKYDKIDKVFLQRSRVQEKLAGVLTSASPLSNFVFIATGLTETGIEAEDHWDREVGEYDRALATYADAQYKKAMERDPSFDSNDYLDLRARPRFQYRPAGLLERVEPDLPQWGVLIAFNLIFFAAAFVSFQRYDVR